MGRVQELPRLFLDGKPLKIIQLLGEGAFAVVFLAEWEKRRLAVKVLKPNQTAAHEPFQQEYLLGKNLCHPVFARFYRFGWTEGETPFYSMELLKGKGLKEGWSKRDPLSQKLLCYQLFLGLTLLHKKGLVHRDLKPSNLMVVPPSRAGLLTQLKIMDLGLAQSAAPSKEESVGGTVDYLAPELVRKEKPDFRADFYACGIILCELFLGRPPFADPDPAATLARHQEAPLPQLPIPRPREKEFWQNLINRLAAKNKEERPREGAEVLNLLLEDSVLRRILARQAESASGWCRTLLPRFWVSPASRLENELSAEVPETVVRGKEELADKRDLEKLAQVFSVRLALEAGISARAYPRLSEKELENWLAFNFSGSKEASGVLWQKTTGELSLIESELAFWQKKKWLRWNEAAWEWREDSLKDIPLAPASQKELLALASTLPDEECRLLGRLSLIRGYFRPEEITGAGLWEQGNFEPLLKNLQQTGFLISVDEERWAFSRPGLREALYGTVKASKSFHRKIWNYFARSNQIAGKPRSSEWEYQAAGAGLWEEAARQALAAAGEAGAKEDFKTENWYLDRSLKWVQKLPAGFRRDGVLLDIFRERGNFFGRQGELRKAILEFSHLVQTAQKRQNREAEADAFNRLGNHFRQLPDYPKAEMALKKALTLFQKSGNELKCSYAHNNLGATYAHQLRFVEALKHYTKAAEIQRRLGATKNLASTLNNIGGAHAFADRLQKAIPYFREALELNRTLDEKEEMALCLNNLGYIQVLRGEYGEAQKLLLEALELNRQIDSRKWEVNNLDNLALVAYRTGDYPEAIRYALSGLELSEKINFKGNHLSLLASLGGSLKAQGQYAEAEKYLTRGCSLVEEIHDLSSEIPLRLEKIELALLVNDLPEAEKAAAQTKDRIREVSDAALRSRLLMLLGKITARKGKNSEAKKYFDQAQKLLSKSEHFPERRMLALEKAHQQTAEGPREKIEELLAGVGSLSAGPLDRPQVCEKLFLEARASLQAGRLQPARQQASEALKLSYELAEPEKIWRLHHLLARLWTEEKNYQKAFLELQSAAKVLESLKNNFVTEEEAARYFQDPEKIDLLSEIQKVALFLSR